MAKVKIIFFYQTTKPRGYPPGFVLALLVIWWNLFFIGNYQKLNELNQHGVIQNVIAYIAFLGCLERVAAAFRFMHKHFEERDLRSASEIQSR